MSACDLKSTSTQSTKTKNSESRGGQVKLLMKAIDTEIKLVNDELPGDSELIFTGKALGQLSDKECDVHVPSFISNQDDKFESTIAQGSSAIECKQFNEAEKPYAAKVDDHSVSVLLSNSKGDDQERSVPSFLKGRVEHGQHRLEIQQRAKNLLHVADDKVTSSVGRWKGSLEIDDEENEETSLLNAGQPDQSWCGGEESRYSSRSY